VKNLKEKNLKTEILFSLAHFSKKFYGRQD
jgi:hypothetical protein